MNYTNSHIYALQLLVYFVTQHNYQIVTLKESQNSDYWLVNPQNEKYPVICIVSNEAENHAEAYMNNVFRAVLNLIQREGKLTVLHTSENYLFAESELIHHSAAYANAAFSAEIARDFSGIEKIAHPVSNNKLEYARLARMLEQKAFKQAKKQGKIKMITLPKTTMIISAICLIVFLLVNLLALFCEDSVVATILMGGYYKMSVVAGLEYFRLLTAGFVHYDIWHLFMNVWALMNIGMIFEQVYSKKQYVIILLASIVMGNVFVLIGDANIVGCGISGGLFGLLGAYVVSLFNSGAIKIPAVRTNLISILMLNLFISLMPGISLMAHLGGFVCGAMLGFLFTQNMKWLTLKTHTRNAFVLLVIGLVLMMGNARRIAPAYPGTDAAIIATIKDAGFSGYADYLSDRFIQQMESQDDFKYGLELQAGIAQYQQGVK